MKTFSYIRYTGIVHVRYFLQTSCLLCHDNYSADANRKKIYCLWLEMIYSQCIIVPNKYQITLFSQYQYFSIEVCLIKEQIFEMLYVTNDQIYVISLNHLHFISFVSNAQCWQQWKICIYCRMRMSEGACSYIKITTMSCLCNNSWMW